MTKTQAKKKVGKIRELLMELNDEVMETIDEIEPYEGKDDLTEQQEERLEWFENLQSELDNALDNLAEYEE